MKSPRRTMRRELEGAVRPHIDLEQDTPELVALVREGIESRHTVHKQGDIQKILTRVRARLGR
jgi:hypothetical protein